jgi:hypothetical protein
MSASSNKTFETKEDVARWKKKPTIHPITGATIIEDSSEYKELYLKAYLILEKITDDIAPLLPKEHLLFGNIDLLYYSLTGKSYDPSTESMSELFLISIANFSERESKLENEIEWLKNLVSKKPVYQEVDGEKYEINSLMILTIHITKHIEYIMTFLYHKDFNYKKANLDFIKNSNPDPRGRDLIRFMEKNKLQNGMIIMDFLKERSNLSWSRDFLILLNRYISVYLDIADLLDPNSGIIQNYENIRFDPIPDPVDKYFSEYETKLKKIKDPKFSRLIDITTFKPTDKNVYLNDEQFKEFNIAYKEAEIEYNKLKKQYEKDYDEYIKKQSAKSAKSSPAKPDKSSKSGPKMPKRPIISYGNGLQYTYGNILPTHIPNKLLEQFNKEYDKVKDTIEEYNKVKNMSYVKLVKEITNSSPTSPIKNQMNEQELFKMSREQIKDNILFKESSGSSLKDRCNESTDILTKDDFDDENYPLAKLQLMVRLKMNNKTECIYAPALYNYLVKCVKKQQPFVNPKTRQEYTADHINKLMNVMKIVDKNITVPYYVPHLHDKRLFIEYEVEELVFSEFDEFSNMVGWNNITSVTFDKISIYRKFGEDTYRLFKICYMPSDIEITDTGSPALTSVVMLNSITQLFREGQLMNKYVPPYYEVINGKKQYITLPIRFSEYKDIIDWMFHKDTGKPSTRQEFIDKFKEFAQEINNFI